MCVWGGGGRWVGAREGKRGVGLSACRARAPTTPCCCRSLSQPSTGTQDLSWGWRLSLGLAIVPAIILTIGGIILPESPNSLIER